AFANRGWRAGSDGWDDRLLGVPLLADVSHLVADHPPPQHQGEAAEDPPLRRVGEVAEVQPGVLDPGGADRLDRRWPAGRRRWVLRAETQLTGIHRTAPDVHPLR